MPQTCDAQMCGGLHGCKAIPPRESHRQAEEQKQLLKDANLTRTVRTSVQNDGVKTVVEKQQRVLPWRQLPDRSYSFFVRLSLKPIEFEKGKTAVSVSSIDKLPSVIDT